jgi:hypothetical protein
MLYASQFQLNMLRQYRYPDQLYVDGTFKCVPPETKLVATALLRSKKTEDYGSMWASISSLVKQFLEKQIIINCDFEKSHHNAIQNQFGPRATIIGCFFHLLQATHKWLKKNKCIETIEERQDLDDDIRYLASVTGTFEEQKKIFTQKYQSVPTFLEYFSKTYLEDDALFPPRMWARGKINISPEYKIDMTNNVSESWNRQTPILKVRYFFRDQNLIYIIR